MHVTYCRECAAEICQNCGHALSRHEERWELETPEQTGGEVQSAGMPLHHLNFHDDALAVIANINRVSVWREDMQGETPGRVVTIRTKYADTRYL